jgi:hypothetical protein
LPEGFRVYQSDQNIEKSPIFGNGQNCCQNIKVQIESQKLLFLSVIIRRTKHVLKLISFKLPKLKVAKWQNYAQSGHTGVYQQSTTSNNTEILIKTLLSTLINKTLHLCFYILL